MSSEYVKPRDPDDAVLIHEVAIDPMEGGRRIDVRIYKSKKYFVVGQGYNAIAVDRFQALELAKELLNYREWLKVGE